MKRNQLILKSIILFSLMLLSENINAQTTQVAVVDSSSVESSRLKFACGFGLNFVGGTNISLSPNLVYKVSDKVSFGAGLQGSYNAIKDLQKTSTIGANVISFYNPSKTFTMLLEFVELNVTTKRETPEGEIKNNFWDSALFVGAGVNITRKVTIGAKYNLLYKEDESVYTSAIIPFVNITF
ncbi:MAG: hypothetical protein KJO41_02945 [Bacteroidia bacterium]|nr:hypothetical protein [Bacteroidia bacterium]NND26684.1 hypothetical protein [Flavobacteriaceae bacterium]MBT8277933.1 hypothetical protein [Bacteroidia bacterium]NNK59150.1 hypothetical protein [Flavobacteriaceae bacterium]NNL32211.1 hypothetical protein [Flavobacteriaceae bacterium]